MNSQRFLVFNGVNTLIDWHFVLSDFSFSLPQIREERQDIPGMDGDLDYTDAISGRANYKTRQLKAMLSSTYGSRGDRLAAVEAIVNLIHGKRCDIEMPDRPGLVAHGRVTVEVKTDHPAYTEINIDATCDPFLDEADIQSVEIPILPTGNNCLNDDTVTFSEDYSSCDTAEFSEFNNSVSITVGEIGSRAVFQVELEPNSRFYFASRVFGGRGKIFVSSDPEAADGSAGFINSGASGTVYLIAEKYSQEALFATFVLLDAADVVTLNSGSSASSCRFRYSSSGLPSLGFILNGNITVYASRNIDVESVLQPGNNYSAVIVLRQTASGSFSAEWKKVRL